MMSSSTTSPRSPPRTPKTIALTFGVESVSVSVFTPGMMGVLVGVGGESGEAIFGVDVGV